MKDNIENMFFRIRQISPEYNSNNKVENISIDYQGNNDNRSFSVSGSFKITKEKFDLNQSFEDLVELSKQDSLEKIMSGDFEEETFEDSYPEE